MLLKAHDRFPVTSPPGWLLSFQGTSAASVGRRGASLKTAEKIMEIVKLGPKEASAPEWASSRRAVE